MLSYSTGVSRQSTVFSEDCQEEEGPHSSGNKWCVRKMCRVNVVTRAVSLSVTGRELEDE